MYINTNVAALFAENSLNNTQSSLNTLQQEMSTGLQINSPSDNPSGLAISNLMQGEMGGINAAANNATQANNLLNTANGGMQTDVSIVQEIQQLAVQASNSTNNLQDTQDIQNQIGQLLDTLDNVGQTLNFNNQNVLGNGATAAAPLISSSDVVTTSGADQFVNVSNSSAAIGTYSVTASYTASYAMTYTSTGGTYGSVVTSVALNLFSTPGTFSVVVDAATTAGQVNATVTVDLTNTAGSILASTSFTVASTAIDSGAAATQTVVVDGASVAIQYASLAANTPVTAAFSVTGAYTVTATAYSGASVLGTLSYTTSASDTPLTGYQSIAIAGATVGLNLASVVTSSVASLSEDFSVTSPLLSLAVGADSGNVLGGLYTVSMSYSSTTGSGTDNVTITGPDGYSATGSVSNLASMSGTVTIQLVAGSNMTGENSFVLQVNQSQVSATTANLTFGVSVTQAQQYTFQTGPTQGDGNAISLGFGSFNSVTLGMNNIDVTSTSGAQYAITQAQQALSMLTNAQGQVGAQVDQLNYTISNLQTQTTNLQSSQSSIMDANMAQVTSSFAQEQILMQTGIQALTTAQQLPSLVLKLLS